MNPVSKKIVAFATASAMLVPGGIFLAVGSSAKEGRPGGGGQTISKPERPSPPKCNLMKESSKKRLEGSRKFSENKRNQFQQPQKSTNKNREQKRQEIPEAAKREIKAAMEAFKADMSKAKRVFAAQCDEVAAIVKNATKNEAAALQQARSNYKKAVESKSGVEEAKATLTKAHEDFREALKKVKPQVEGKIKSAHKEYRDAAKKATEKLQAEMKRIREAYGSKR